MKKPFTIYRIIRIDGTYDDARGQNEQEITDEATQKVIADCNSHNHTIENGIEIEDITDCGEAY